ncbi:MAG: WD40 repeat domain-containing protein, partial [Pirellulaceae bacterium]
RDVPPAPPKPLAPTPPVTTDRDIEGLTLAGDGMFYGVTHPATDKDKVSYLVRINPQTFDYENLGELSFGAFCLAADLRPRRADEPLQITTAERLFTGPKSHGFSIAVSKDGGQALVGHYVRGVSLWDVASGTQIREFPGPQKAVNNVLFWPDGKHVAACSEDGSIRLWDREAAQEVRQFRGHTGRVDCLALSRDGSLLLSGSADYGQDRDHSVRLWDAASGNELRRFGEVAKYTRKLVFSHDAGRAYGAVVGSNSVIEWNVASGAVVHRFQGQPTVPLSLAVSPDGRWLATGHLARHHKDNHWNDPENAVVRIWDLKTRSVIRELRGHAGPVGDVAFTPDGRYLLSAATDEHDAGSKFIVSSDQTVRLWEMQTGREVARYQVQERVIQLAVLPDGKSFLTAGDSIRLWRLPQSAWPLETREFSDLAAPPAAVAPFDAAAAGHLQDAWAKHLGVPVEYTNSLGMKFRLIPPGEFEMGSTDEVLRQLPPRDEWFFAQWTS